MGRSNHAARRRNAKGRLNRREKGSGRRPSVKSPPPGLDSLVIPDGRCFRNPRRPKNIWATEAKAAKALRSARADADRRGTPIEKVEKRYYACLESEGGCGGFHLTSREAFIERPS